MGKSQRELAANLGVSLKAIQSYEQGWRRIPDSLEKNILLYLSLLNRKVHPDINDCWQINKCGEELRSECLVGEVGLGKECWFVGGNICRGLELKNWKEKRKICFKCDVFLQNLRFLEGTVLYKEILDT